MAMHTKKRCVYRHDKSASALVIVMVFIAMIVVLAVAVLEMGLGAKKQTTRAQRISEVDALERLPAQIIITQLQRATTQATTKEGERLTWASQPGMIRVFGSQPESGNERPSAKMHHRLYSAPIMNSTTLDLSAEAAALNQWADKPAAYTDLNEPVFTSRGTRPTRIFPIADPAALGRVEGFYCRNAVPGVSAAHPLPMPAAWIYILRDGQMVVPTSADDRKAVFEEGTAPKSNPIVGRIAFWTDDESCKLNLNTATEADPWDFPAANTRTERGYASNPPHEYEFHRMSWHPAFTSLSPVLRTFGGASFKSPQWPKPDRLDPSSFSHPPHIACYQALVPHGLGTDQTPRQDRHFTTVDEFYFDPQRQQNGIGSGFLMEQNDLNMARFFLTTRSSSPELNPFGGPKIALCMMAQEPTARSVADQRVATITALNADKPQRQEFAFQRANPWTNPNNPGSTQSVSEDWSLVQRNRELYAWLQKLSAQSVPGFGGSFLAKYGAQNRDQILTSMLDMLRWSTNPQGHLPPGLSAANPQGLAEHSAVPLTLETSSGETRGFGRFPTITEIAVVFAFTDVERNPNGQPRDDNSDGICDRATKLRAFIVLNPFVPANGPPAVSPAWSVRIRRLMQWTLGNGISPLLPGGNVRNRCTLSGSQVLGTGTAWGGNNSSYACFASQFIQADGSPKAIGKREDPGRDYPFISLVDVTLPNGNGKPGSTLKFSGGRIIVDLMEPNAPASQPKPNDAIHSVEVEFPVTQLPMPSLRVSDFSSGPKKLDHRFIPVTSGSETRLPLIQQGDIVRSMILNPKGPSRGDVRLLAAHRELFFPDAANWFAPHPDYHSPSVLVAHSLRDGAYMVSGQYGSPSLQPPAQTSGSLLPSVDYAATAIPAVPLGLKGALQIGTSQDTGERLGDWESGAGSLEDGPYLNRSHASPEASFLLGSSIGPIPSPSVKPMSQFTSAVLFGAIPSGVFGDASDETPRPWQSLLFCPNPAGRSTPASQPGLYGGPARDHPGFASPPDHLWLEFFTMPVLEPWPMTSGFATAGKVNLNHQLVPYTWLDRQTALHGALKGVRLTAIPTTALDHQGTSAKGQSDSTALDATFRYEVDADKTVQGLSQRFDRGEIYRTPSEICEQFLVPKRISGHIYSGNGFNPPDPATLIAEEMHTWWNGTDNNHSDAFEATGDNLRESPYAQLHPRLCTQSNAYRVHYRVQLLQKSRTTKPDEWNEQQDHLIAERRGDSLIERAFHDSIEPAPDPATSDSSASLHSKQRFRVIMHTPFAP
jgi:uncharacterized protein (TIGR02600 family)